MYSHFYNINQLSDNIFTLSPFYKSLLIVPLHILGTGSLIFIDIFLWGVMLKPQKFYKLNESFWIWKVTGAHSEIWWLSFNSYRKETESRVWFSVINNNQHLWSAYILWSPWWVHFAYFRLSYDGWFANIPFSTTTEAKEGCLVLEI